MNTALETIKHNFNNRIAFRDRGNHRIQLIAPFYHEDGDMYDIYIDDSRAPEVYRVCDYGLTLMRLSYTFEHDTPKNESVIEKILTKNGIGNDDGNLFIDVKPEYLYAAILRFSQVISKITNIKEFKRDLAKSVFYDELFGFIRESLGEYIPSFNYIPIPDREELEVDVFFPAKPDRPLFLFGVKDTAKARLVGVSCLQFQLQKIPFRSIIVHEDFDQLPSKDRKIITNIADKQFPDLSYFIQNGKDYLQREVA